MTFFDESDFSWTIFATEISKDPDLIQTLCLHEKKSIFFIIFLLKYITRIDSSYIMCNFIILKI